MSDQEEWKIGSEIAQEVVAGIMREASAQEDANSIAQRKVGATVHAQIWTARKSKTKERRKAGKRVTRLAAQWDEEQQLDKFLERRMEGSTLHLDVIQKAPELAVHERMSQGKRSEWYKSQHESEGMVHGRDEGKSQMFLWKKTRKKSVNGKV